MSYGYSELENNNQMSLASSMVGDLSLQTPNVEYSSTSIKKEILVSLTDLTSEDWPSWYLSWYFRLRGMQEPEGRWGSADGRWWTKVRLRMISGESLTVISRHGHTALVQHWWSHCGPACPGMIPPHLSTSSVESHSLTFLITRTNTGD